MKPLRKLRQIKHSFLVGILAVFCISCDRQDKNIDIEELDQSVVESNEPTVQDSAELAEKTQTMQIDPKQFLREGEPEIPQLSLPEVENCPDGCCAMRALSQSDYPKTPIRFPKVVPDFQHDCAYCEKDVQRLGAGMVAILNGTPTFLCSTGCYSYLLSDPKTVLSQYREKNGYQ